MLPFEDQRDRMIVELREQVHQSFMQVQPKSTQINEMQKLFTMQLDHAKEDLLERERALREKEQELSSERKQWIEKMKQWEEAKASSQISIGDIDESEIRDSGTADFTQRDSTIFSRLQQILQSEEQLRISDPEQLLCQIRDLHRIVQDSLCVGSPHLVKLASMAKQFCLQNFRLRQELKNATEANEVYNKKLDELTCALTICKGNEYQAIAACQKLTSENMRLELLAASQEQQLAKKRKEFNFLQTELQKLQDSYKCKKESQSEILSKSILSEHRYNQERNRNEDPHELKCKKQPVLQCRFSLTNGQKPSFRKKTSRYSPENRPA